MYHGAEHKCINCIEHGLPLTVENVMKSSKEHKRCGTSFLLIVMVISILFFLVIRPETLWLRLVSRILLIPVIAGVSFEFLRLAGNSDNPVVNLLISGINEISPTKAIKIAIRSTPSKSAIQMPFPRSGFMSVDTHVGNTIKIPMANIIEITMVRSIITFSALSPNFFWSHFSKRPGSSSSSPSSIKRLAE